MHELKFETAELEFLKTKLLPLQDDRAKKILKRIKGKGITIFCV